MKDSSKVMMNIENMKDIKQLTSLPNIKYLNLSITSPNLEVIYYLIEHGQNYSYSERINNQNGYIYVPYETFKQSMTFILDIINNIPLNLNELEIARYLYIVIGKNLGYDINILPDKNETFNLKNINTINNIWGSLACTKGTNISLSKLYLYLCRIMNIDCTLITTSKIGYTKNILTINNRKIITDITQDLPFIQAGFKTRHFSSYNDSLELDQKISYIKDSYNEDKIDLTLRTLDFTKPDIFKTILSETGKIIDASNLKPIELGMIYELIFSEYCPNDNISINNLYIQDSPNTKEHFILINHQDKCYSYNYTRNNFVEITKEDILNNIENKKIGIYLNEKLPFLTTRERTL